MKTGPMTKEDFLGLIGLAGFISTGESEISPDKHGGMTHNRVYCYRLGANGIEQRKIGYYEDTLGNFGAKVVGGIYPDLIFGAIGKDAEVRVAFEVAPDIVPVVEPSLAEISEKAAIVAIESKVQVLKAAVESKIGDCYIVRAIVNEAGVATEKKFAVLGKTVLPCKE